MHAAIFIAGDAVVFGVSAAARSQPKSFSCTGYAAFISFLWPCLRPHRALAAYRNSRTNYLVCFRLPQCLRHSSKASLPLYSL